MCGDSAPNVRFLHYWIKYRQILGPMGRYTWTISWEHRIYGSVALRTVDILWDYCMYPCTQYSDWCSSDTPLKGREDPLSMLEHQHSWQEVNCSMGAGIHEECKVSSGKTNSPAAIELSLVVELLSDEELVSLLEEFSSDWVVWTAVSWSLSGSWSEFARRTTWKAVTTL